MTAAGLDRDQLARQIGERTVCLGTVEAAAQAPSLTPAEVAAALRRAVGPDGRQDTLFDVIKPGESVCFIVSDATRKTAADQVLPPLLAGLRAAGCSPQDFFFVVATGIHRPPTAAEVRAILGPAVAAEFAGRVFAHNPDDDAQLVYVGTTRRGQRVRVNRRVMEADRRVALGTASYHYHAGFGGGRKSLVPGVASRDTIAQNHSLTLDPAADRIHPAVELGRLDGNPVAEEMLEAARLCRPDPIVNTVLSPGGALVGVFTGELDAAHRAACRLVEQTCRVDLPSPADFVIASAQGAPNWVQSHKALVHAHRAIRPGGRVILLAPCPEGIGDERFRYWLRKPSCAALFAELRRRVEVNGQTALSTKQRGADALLVTTLSAADRADLGLRTAESLDAAVETVLREFRPAPGAAPRPTCYVMPTARYTVPFVAEFTARAPSRGE